MAQILLKRGTAARWAELNLILAAGEPGFVTDENRFKIGDGVTAWNDLPYIGEGNVVNANSISEFPSVGRVNVIYKIESEGKIYQWNSTKFEYELLGSADNSVSSLRPVDGTIVIVNNGKDATIGVAISKSPNNALVAVEGGLFVPSHIAGDGIEIVENKISVKLADTAHGLVAVDGTLALNLATKDSDGAMSKEDKAFIDELPLELDAIRQYINELENSLVWDEM